MKTHNWQTKALTLFIAAAALWLAAACGDTGTEYAIGDSITPSAPCGPDMPLEPSEEFKQFVGREKVYPFLRSDIRSRAYRLRAERLKPETERIQAILDKYRDRIRSHSGEHYEGYLVETIFNEAYLPTDKQVIQVYLAEYVDPSELSPEDRMPECIEGIEVHFILGPIGILQLTKE